MNRLRENAHLYNDEAELRGRVVLQIHEVHGTARNKDHAPATEANSTVQHCWLLPYQRQDKIIYVSDVQRCERAAGNQI